MVNVNKAKFKDIPLKLYDPKWGSKLANTIIELEKLRIKKLGGPVPPYIFFQLKNIFQILESLGSARIEGNHTTLAEFVEKIIENPSRKTKIEKDKEIFNIEKAIDFIEKNVKKTSKIDRALVSEIHKILVEGLSPSPAGEGSKFPGELRPINVIIKKSNHVPPEAIKVAEYFNELINFINQPLDSQYHLLTIALSHHRMAWIHPFDNGNGRLVRMFTYALLIKQGFQVKSGRILNPTAIFCMDRGKYYDKLSLADTGEKDKMLEWCLYVLDGLRVEIEKIDKLLDISYITNTILLPMLLFAFENGHITKREHEILSALVKSKKMIIKSSDLEKMIGQESSVQRSRILRKLKDKKMLISLKENGRIYTIGFANNYLLRGVMHILEKNNFIPASLNYNN
ncbi:cell filamentation protein Fic [Candidatus Falkowbacteria bacterium CG11_big_fil_rev_8_21_14_0_20_39_10]|uniref:Cell filamentation protein Fic n=1 Tax=Candidatus Falkowbacteria bacterium CG11_big_fil_rev_8_21_14_0_20_39_10 TaxID=1974570 RepID=A0A2M6K9Y8_9BACT|nr:MAG: cell filamentation protein Fic [Candidatus Falkowbacteria bacterium CG11_big_fil_rev_8_21_14_0_20_39_10]